MVCRRLQPSSFKLRGEITGRNNTKIAITFSTKFAEVCAKIENISLVILLQPITTNIGKMGSKVSVEAVVAMHADLDAKHIFRI